MLWHLLALLFGLVLELAAEAEAEDASCAASVIQRRAAHKKVDEASTAEGEVGMRTKLIAGVEVILHADSDVQRGGVGKWILSLKSGCSSSDIADMAASALSSPNGTVPVFQGHPSEGGLCVLMLTGTEVQLETFLAGRDWPITPTIETDSEWSVIPEVEEKDVEMGMAGQLEVSGSQRRWFFWDEAPTTEPPEGNSLPLSWGLDRIDSRHGLDSRFTPPPQMHAGRGVHVYVLDSGIRTTHSEFGGRAIPTLEVLGMSSPMECDPTNSSCALDGHGHGTHCAGIIGGRTHGVASEAQLHAVKTMTDRGTGSFSWFIQALDWIMLEGKRPAIISTSLGGRGSLETVVNAVESVVSAGLSVVVAAGNGHGDACFVSPANAPSAITVGATGRDDVRGDDVRAPFSNYGACLDIFAPGLRILTASHRSDIAAATSSGTSVAATHVAGALALMLGEDPSRKPKELTEMLVSWGTVGVVQKTMAASPNLLLNVGSDCSDYVNKSGCGWTAQHNCPGQRNGTVGSASNFSSLGFSCCCQQGLWRAEGMCAAYMARSGCRWTSRWSCPGQPLGSRGLAKLPEENEQDSDSDNGDEVEREGGPHGAIGFECCCARGLWSVLPEEVTTDDPSMWVVRLGGCKQWWLQRLQTAIPHGSRFMTQPNSTCAFMLQGTRKQLVQELSRHSLPSHPSIEQASSRTQYWR